MYLRYLANQTRHRAKQLVFLGVATLCLFQVLISPISVFAADQCFSSEAQGTALSTPSDGGLSACQRQVFDRGIYNFDVATQTQAQTCVVETSAEFSGSDGAESLYNYLISQPVEGGASEGQGHLAPLQVAAIMGNIAVESGFDPTATNPSSGAHGLVQWLGGRYDNLVKYAQSKNTSKDDFGTQSSFIWVELTGSYKDSTLIPLSQATDIAAATKIVDDNYEVSGGASIDKRISDAQDVLSQYGTDASASSDQDVSQTVTTASADGGCDSVSEAGQDTKYVDGFTIYSQYDPTWKDKPYGTSNIGNSGCAPSAMAMIITALTGKKVTPAATTAYANTQNLYVPHAGSSWQIAPVLAKHWNLNATATGANLQKITATLQAGGLVIGSGDGSLPFTSAGHYIVIRGVTTDGKWLIGDSAHDDTSSKPWDPQEILTQMHDGSVYAITKGGVSI